MYGKTARHGQQVRERILDYIVSYISQHGYSPTVREITEGVGLKSTSSVYNHLLRMLDEGVI